jgi:hypothetical protein
MDGNIVSTASIAILNPSLDMPTIIGTAGFANGEEYLNPRYGQICSCPQLQKG